MKIDLREVKVADIEGHEVSLDMNKVLGNQLYMQGQSLLECEFGKRLYYADGPIEATEEQVEILRRLAKPLPFLTRTAVLELLKQ